MRPHERQIMKCLDHCGPGIYTLRLNRDYGFYPLNGGLLHRPTGQLYQPGSQSINGIFRGRLMEDDFPFEVAKDYRIDVPYRAVYTLLRRYSIKRFHDDVRPLAKVNAKDRNGRMIDGRLFYSVPQAADLDQVSIATMLKWAHASRAKSHTPEMPDITIEVHRDRFTGDFLIPKESVEKLKLENRVVHV